MTPSPQTLTVCRASAGTGKTYTLAANYVALLFSKQSYRSILAVTFTNKATQEMKDRILLFLDNIANNTGADADAALRAVRSRMIANLSASDDELRADAARYYRNMLEDYDNIHISTIDTFLMQLLNGLGQMLDDASAGAQVELDLPQIISVAVDNLLTRPVVKDTMFRHLANYVTERLEAGKSWDIRSQLREIALKLYTESVQQLDAAGQIVFDAEVILKYKANCDWRQAAALRDLNSLYAEWRDWKTADDGISGATYIDKFIAEIATYLDGTCKEKDMFRGFTDSVRTKLVAEKGASLRAKYKNDVRRADYVVEALVRLDELCHLCARAYNTYRCTVALLNDMALMTALRAEIQAVLVEQNTVLLAQTADKLHRAMAVGDADFILEKAGIRYRHIMLDEFQDTSVLQWENFKPLVEEILANGGTVFIVGDIKQSIYRWRNGNWQIMAGLNTGTPVIGPYYHDMPLIRNFRSAREIVQFNLTLFRQLTADGYGNEFAESLYDEQYGTHDITDYYRAGHEGGMVRLSLYPYAKDRTFASAADAKDSIMAAMFDEILLRLQCGESPSDMLILVRGHKEAETIVSFFRSLLPDTPLFAQTHIVSCDSFHLDASLSVQFLIRSLRWRVLNDDVAKWYIALTFPTADISAIEQINIGLPLSELLEELIKLLPSQPATDIAYINALLDGVHDYTAKYGADKAAFLQYWDEIMHLQSIAAPAVDAIRIMTIHTAKGLEAKNVFIPFCSWKMEEDRQKDILWCEAKALLKAPVTKLKRIPLRMSSALANSEYEQEYRNEHMQQRLDNLNLLYVALTRAQDNLFVYGDLSEKQVSSNDTAAALLLHAFAGKWTETDDIMQLTFGDDKAEQKPRSAAKGKMIDRFSFDKAETQEAHLHVGERPVLFRMSREAVDSLLYAPNDNRTARIDLGNICHSVMEHIETREDCAAAINDALMRGLIADDNMEREVTRLVNAAWTNIQMNDWFSGHWELLRETTFLTANSELRPDRVMIDRETGTAIVLDYKFGQPETKHIHQVREYMRIMVQLQFRHVEGYIWYAQEAKLQSVAL